MSIKDSFEHTEKLYHFTSFNTALKIIESNRLKFGKLTFMNDLHENDKINFVNTSDCHTESFSSDVLDALDDETYKYRQISLTIDKNNKDGFDLHQMWGLYADKGEGVCLVFDKNELGKNADMANVFHDCVNYDDTSMLESFFISNSNTSKMVVEEVCKNVTKIFFHKRKEWEHEQEYRLLKRCPNPQKEEYLLLGHALKFIIVSSKLQNMDEVLFFERIEILEKIVEKTIALRNIDKECEIPVIVYGNGLFVYSLSSANGKEQIWNSKEGYDILSPGINCDLSI